MSALPRLISLGLCSCAFICLTAATAAPQDETATIRRFMEAYRSAVVRHDGERVAKLFVPTGSAWFNVLSDDGYAAARSKSPGALKVRPGTVADFAKFVSGTKVDLDPQHGPVRIETDGTIASVYFEFRFHINGKLQNTGSESWQLVKYPDGWRIASIVYSSTPPKD